MSVWFLLHLLEWTIHKIISSNFWSEAAIDGVKKERSTTTNHVRHRRVRRRNEVRKHNQIQLIFPLQCLIKFSLFFIPSIFSMLCTIVSQASFHPWSKLEHLSGPLAGSMPACSLLYCLGHWVECFRGLRDRYVLPSEVSCLEQISP